MLDRWYKIAAIAASAIIIVSAIVGPGIAGIFWLARLDNDVADLQKDVTELQEDVEKLQQGQAAILEILQTLSDNMTVNQTNLRNHTHDSNGGAQLPLSDK